MMLSYEWRELEMLCDRIGDLRLRLAAAQRSKHGGLIDGLKAEIATQRRQRKQLVQHIAARLGSAAGERGISSETGDDRLPDRQDADPSHAAHADRLPLL